MERTCYIPLICIATVLMMCCSCADKEKVKERIAQETSFLHRSQEALPVPVRIITATATEALSGTNYVGRVEPSKSALILNRYSGTLEVLNAVKGRHVSKGTVIAKVNSESVKSAYDIAKSTLDQAEDGYARLEKVYGSGSVTEVKMVEIRTQLEKARAAEKAARQALEDCEIKAPFSGVIGEIYCQRGESLPVAAPIVQIIDVESVEIHFSVPENEYVKIPVGTKAEIGIPALEKTINGTVAVRGVSASQLSHAYDFTIKGLSDPGSLMPGMVCKVRILSEQDAKVIIPSSAVMTDMSGRYVWGVTTEDDVCKTYVTVSGYAEDGIVISDGITAGDRIIVEGSRKVSTGMKVKAVE